MNHLVIRAYQPADWHEIERIHDAARKIELSLAGLSEAFLPLAIAVEREDLFAYHVCVAVFQGAVAGFAAYSEDELAWLYVDPAHMRRGIGRSLVQYVMDHTGQRPLCIEVLQGNEPALQLYRSMGFETVETVSGHMPGNEAFPVCVHCMQLL